MRTTLEQLKAMSDKELYNHWRLGKFPFELLGCGACLTLHRPWSMTYCRNPKHKDLISSTETLPHEPSSVIMRTHLEELYALRLFYDSLYPQETPTPQTEQAVAESEIPVGD